MNPDIGLPPAVQRMKLRRRIAYEREVIRRAYELTCPPLQRQQPPDWATQMHRELQ